MSVTSWKYRAPRENGRVAIWRYLARHDNALRIQSFMRMCWVRWRIQQWKSNSTDIQVVGASCEGGDVRILWCVEQQLRLGLLAWGRKRRR